AVRRLCDTALWLDQGQLKFQGSTSDCIGQYLLRHMATGGRTEYEPPHAFGNGMPAVLRSVQISGPDDSVQAHFSARLPLRIRIEWDSLAPIYKPRIWFIFQTADRQDGLTA